MLKSVALCSTKVSNISIGGDSCPALETLELTFNNDLRELETLPEKLKTLNVGYCEVLKGIRGVRGLNELKSLEICNCKMLDELPCFAELVSLENLRLEGSSKLKKIEGLEKLRSLRELIIENIDELPSFAEYTSLKNLVLRNCNKLEEIENLGYLKSLEELEISHCPELKSLPDSLEHLSLLRDLTIEDTGVKCLPKSLIHLQSLTISSTPISELSFRSWGMLKYVALWSTKVSKISIGGDSCPALETLDIFSNKDLRELETLPEKLKTLNVSDCEVLKDIRGVRGLNELKRLEICNCKMLDELPCFAELVSLETFRLEKSSKFKKIEGLEKLRSLRELTIENIDELPSFAEYTSLTKLVLCNSNKLEEIENLGYLKSLEELRISHCRELKALPGLQEIFSLKIIELSDCLELESLPNLSKITSLQEFQLENCYKLEKIEGLERLRRLNKLKVHTRWNAPGIVSLEHSEKLWSLDVVANDISAAEPFVSNIQTWPRTVMICSRAACDVGLLKNLFQNVPNVSVLDYAALVEADPWDGNRLELSPPESSAIADAILRCFIIDSDHPDLRLSIQFETFYGDFYSELGEGKWVWMGVATQRWRSVYHDYIFARDSKGDHVKVRVEAAWLVTGEERSILEVFHQHFRRYQ